MQAKNLQTAVVVFRLYGTGLYVGNNLTTISTGQVVTFTYEGRGTLKAGLSISDSWVIEQQTVTVGRGVIGGRNCSLASQAQCLSTCSYSRQYTEWVQSC